MNFYCAACDKRLFDGTIKLCRDNNTSRRPTRTRITRVPFCALGSDAAARRNSVITFWIGSSELGVQSHSLALPPYVPRRRLSLFLLVPVLFRFFFFFVVFLFLSAATTPLTFPREHNYRLRVPSQWMVNGAPYSETPYLSSQASG